MWNVLSGFFSCVCSHMLHWRTMMISRTCYKYQKTPKTDWQALHAIEQATWCKMAVFSHTGDTSSAHRAIYLYYIYGCSFFMRTLKTIWLMHDIIFYLWLEENSKLKIMKNSGSGPRCPYVHGAPLTPTASSKCCRWKLSKPFCSPACCGGIWVIHICIIVWL